MTHEERGTAWLELHHEQFCSLQGFSLLEGGEGEWFGRSLEVGYEITRANSILVATKSLDAPETIKSGLQKDLISWKNYVTGNK